MDGTKTATCSKKLMGHSTWSFVGQAARLSRTTNYSAWYDFSKAYDSVSHIQLNGLVGALSVNTKIVNAIKAIIKKWAIVIEIGKEKTTPIYIRRDIYQGDSMTPLLIVLLTACVVNVIETNTEILKSVKGRQQVAAFMDDFKTHAPTKKSAEMIKTYNKQQVSWVFLLT